MKCTPKQLKLTVFTKGTLSRSSLIIMMAIVLVSTIFITKCYKNFSVHLLHDRYTKVLSLRINTLHSYQYRKIMTTNTSITPFMLLLSLTFIIHSGVISSNHNKRQFIHSYQTKIDGAVFMFVCQSCKWHRNIRHFHSCLCGHRASVESQDSDQSPQLDKQPLTNGSRPERFHRDDTSS